MIRIENKGNKKVLTVDGKPFFLLAGEVHNSDSSSPAYMERIWETAVSMGMNTLLLPVSWEMTEPEEGRFDFSVPEKLIAQARERNMHIVFLWFGSWKNAECMYAPAWVKQDLRRFPRAQLVKGKSKTEIRIFPGLPFGMPYTTLSYLSGETARADAVAFAAFMKFLRNTDAKEQTVLAVQVENETGLLGAGREVSVEADEAFASPVPRDFLAYLKAHTGTMAEDIRAAVENAPDSGSWPEVFGSAAEEVFSAYHVSRFVETVASAGKAVYDLPLAVNCWLDKGGAPGTYPTGGPVSRVHEIWNFCAPSIDVYCPDIYVPQFKQVCDEYTRRGNPLFIPETATHSYCASRMLYTVGHYHAMCYSPFGFDDIGKPFSAEQGFFFGVDVTDPALKTRQDLSEYRSVGRMVQSMLPLLADAYGSGRLQALSAETDSVIPAPNQDSSPARPAFMNFGVFRVEISFPGSAGTGACLCLQVGDCECYIAGKGCGITFRSAKEELPNLDFLLVEEGTFSDGGWHPGRRLNGDETTLLKLDDPGILHIRFFLY